MFKNISFIILLGASMSIADDSRLTEIHSKDKPHLVSFDYADKTAWEQRAEFLRHQAMVSLGLFPMPEKTALTPVIHGEIDRDSYTIKKVYFQSIPGHYVSGNLYVPKNITGKAPAVLAPYGHWPDGRFWWRSDEGIKKELDSGAEKDPIAARSPLQANCANLAKMGCIVFHYDMVGFCDSQAIGHREGFLDADSILNLQSFMGLQTWNSIRSLDFVLSLPEVDPNRIAVTGSSSGGSQSIALNAVDSRITTSFPMAMVSLNMQGGCVCENAPLYRVQTNNTELATLFAPKPQGMACGNDWTFDFLKRGFPEMKSIWKLYGAESDVAAEHFNFGHNHNLHSRQMQYNFFNKHFKLGLPEPVKEQPFEIVPAKELSVYDAEHQPTNAIDAQAVRQWMSEQASTKLKALGDEDYAKAIRIALQAMVVDQLPEPIQVKSHFTMSDSSTRLGYLYREVAGERIRISSFHTGDKAERVMIWLKHTINNDIAVNELLMNMRDVRFINLVPFKSAGNDPTSRPTSVATTGRSNPNPPYEGYNLGYNRSIVAQQVHDILTVIAYARSEEGIKHVSILASGNSAPAALIACAIAGEKVDKAAIDLGGFDFDQIKSDTDSRILPGALKYGGLMSFASLRKPENTRIFNAAPNSQPVRNGPKPEAGSITDPAVLEWLRK